MGTFGTPTERRGVAGLGTALNDWVAWVDLETRITRLSKN
jgi:hypothetical protein